LLHCLSLRLALPHSLFSCPGRPRALHSFPTRRSSDLLEALPVEGGRRTRLGRDAAPPRLDARGRLGPIEPRIAQVELRRECHLRSEEHTSELQSRENLVCRLLLEKKKKKNTCTL